MRKGKSILVNIRVMRRGDLMTEGAVTLELLSERVYSGSGMGIGLQAMPSFQELTLSHEPAGGEGCHVS